MMNLLLLASVFTANVWYLYNVLQDLKPQEKKGDLVAAERKRVLNCPYARELANRNVQKSFGILNSFVSSCPFVRQEFRKEMMTRKDFMDTCKPQLEAVLTSAISDIPSDRIRLKEIAQLLTMKVVLEVFLSDLLSDPSSSPSPRPLILSPNPSHSTILEAADLIEDLWKSPDSLKTSQLHTLFSPAVLSRLIPMYESQWRVVFYSLVEYFRRSDIQDTKEEEESERFVKEVLRMYPPVKSVKRVSEQSSVPIVFSIAEEMKNRDIWGDDVEVFNPAREYTKKQKEEVQKVFGMGELKCVAGFKFVQRFCGSIVRKVVEEYKREDAGEWDKIPDGPLANARGEYEDLFIVKRN